MNAINCIPAGKIATVEAAALDVRQVGQLLTVSARTVERMVQTGEFPAGFVLAGRTRRWSRAAVLAWIEARQEAASATPSS
jgi:excisionase family DNA binding protein